MAAPVYITSVDVLDNPSSFSNPLQFEIQYECLSQLDKDLEWRLTYVGSSESEEYDQVLDSVLVGPVYPGQYRFVFQADPPDASKLPEQEILGITVILLTCSYNDKEFLRVGYYVNNEYPADSEEAQMEEAPKPIRLEKLVRNILADKPRVTKFPIEFDPAPADAIPVAGQMTPPAAGIDFQQQQQQPSSSHQQPWQQQQGDPGSYGGGSLADAFDAADMDEDVQQQESDGMQQDGSAHLGVPVAAGMVM